MIHGFAEAGKLALKQMVQTKSEQGLEEGLETLQPNAVSSYYYAHKVHYFCVNYPRPIALGSVYLGLSAGLAAAVL